MLMLGARGRISDGGVYRHSSFYSALVSGSLNFPNPEPLPKSDDPAWEFDQSDEPVPYLFVADDAFPLSENCMKPCPQSSLTDRKRILNYRLKCFWNMVQSISRFYNIHGPGTRQSKGYYNGNDSAP